VLLTCDIFSVCRCLSPDTWVYFWPVPLWHFVARESQRQKRVGHPGNLLPPHPPPPPGRQGPEVAAHEVCGSELPSRIDQRLRHGSRAKSGPTPHEEQVLNIPGGYREGLFLLRLVSLLLKSPTMYLNSPCLRPYQNGGWI
jgi:hypothetical protein